MNSTFTGLRRKSTSPDEQVERERRIRQGILLEKEKEAKIYSEKMKQATREVGGMSAKIDMITKKHDEVESQLQSEMNLRLSHQELQEEAVEAASEAMIKLKESEDNEVLLKVELANCESKYYLLEKECEALRSAAVEEASEALEKMREFEENENSLKDQLNNVKNELNDRTLKYSLLESEFETVRSTMLSHQELQEEAVEAASEAMEKLKETEESEILLKKLLENKSAEAAEWEVKYSLLQNEYETVRSTMLSHQELQEEAVEAASEAMEKMKETEENEFLLKDELAELRSQYNVLKEECEMLRNTPNGELLKQLKVLERKLQDQQDAENVGFMLDESNFIKAEMLQRQMELQRQQQQRQTDNLYSELQEECRYLREQLQLHTDKNKTESSGESQVVTAKTAEAGDVSSVSTVSSGVCSVCLSRDGVVSSNHLPQLDPSLLASPSLVSSAAAAESASESAVNATASLDEVSDDELRTECRSLRAAVTHLQQKLLNFTEARFEEQYLQQSELLNEDIERKRWLKKNIWCEKQFISLYDELQQECYWLKQELETSHRVNNAQEMQRLNGELNNKLNAAMKRLEEKQRELAELSSQHNALKEECEMLRNTPNGELLKQLKVLERKLQDQQDAENVGFMLDESNFIKAEMLQRQMELQRQQQQRQTDNLYSELQEECRYLREQLKANSVKLPVAPSTPASSGSGSSSTVVYSGMRADQLKDGLMATLDRFSKLSSPLFHSSTKEKTPQSVFIANNDGDELDAGNVTFQDGEEDSFAHALKTPNIGTNKKFGRNRRSATVNNNNLIGDDDDDEAGELVDEYEPVEKARYRVAAAKANVDKLQFQLSSSQEKQADILHQLAVVKGKIDREVTTLPPHSTEQFHHKLIDLKNEESRLLAEGKAIAVELDTLRTKLGSACQEIDEATVSLSKVLAVEAKLSAEIDLELRERLVAVGSELLQSVRVSLNSSEQQQQQQHPANAKTTNKSWANRHAHLLNARLVSLGKELDSKTEKAFQMERKNAELESKLVIMEQKYNATMKELEILRTNAAS